MKKIYYHKLIRDRIPAIMRAKGKTFSLFPLGRKAFEEELLRKIEEEASAMQRVKTRAELIEELADIIDVIEEVCRVKKITKRVIQTKQKQHRKTKGSFKKKYFLVWSEDDGYRTNERKGKRRV